MEFNNLPAPSEYTDWKSWAAMLMQVLQNQEGEGVHNFPLWIEDTSKVRSGMPVAAEGDVIRVKDGQGKVQLKYWDGKAKSWKAFSAAMPSAKRDVLIVGPSGTMYTAPADGYFCLLGTGANTTFGRMYIPVNPAKGASLPLSADGIGANCQLAVSAGDVMKLDYNCKIESLQFVYAVGA